jgi:hypothetical protein
MVKPLIFARQLLVCGLVVLLTVEVASIGGGTLHVFGRVYAGLTSAMACAFILAGGDMCMALLATTFLAVLTTTVGLLASRFMCIFSSLLCASSSTYSLGAAVMTTTALYVYGAALKRGD